MTSITEVHNGVPSLRARRDLVTNPAFDALLVELTALAQTETERLTLDAREREVEKINFQAGVVEGARRALGRLKNYRAAVLEDFRSASDET